MTGDDTDEKARALNLLEVAINGGWSLGSLYFDGREGQYRCQLRRMVRLPAPNGKRARQTFEHENSYGDTVAQSIIRCCQNALEDADQ